MTEKDGIEPSKILDEAFDKNGIEDRREPLLKKNFLRNVGLAHEYGLLTEDNMDKLRRGRAPIITKGSCIGQIIEVNHIIPYSVEPKLGNCLANLDLMPISENREISAQYGDRQKTLMKQLAEAGFLSH